MTTKQCIDSFPCSVAGLRHLSSTKIFESIDHEFNYSRNCLLSPQFVEIKLCTQEI